MHKTCTKLLGIFLLLFVAGQSYSQKIEAENATLSGGAARQSCAECSGGAAVAQGEGNLTFTITLPEEAFYNISLMLAAPNGDKTNVIAIGGNSADFFVQQNSQYVKQRVVSTHKLQAGQNTIEIKKSWGWINIDYLELEKVDASQRFKLNQRLVNPHATAEATALFDFLLDNYRNKIISGAMTLASMDEVNWLKQNTGKEPALLGLDFMHSGRGYGWYNSKEPIQDAESWYKRRGIPSLMWHWRDPLRRTEEFYTKSTSKQEGTDFDISKISDPASEEYTAMLQDIDYIAGLLKELQEKGVPVIWRPLHEAAGGWFWWGAKGPEPLKQLWLLMYDRMVNFHGLNNLIWVWTREPGDDAWYPGDAVVDMVGRDIYKDGDHSSHVMEFNNLNALYEGKKMIALSEVGSFPDVDNLVKDAAAWSWWMPWYGAYTRDSRYNSLDLWKKMFAHDYVITLDEMPDLKAYVRQDPEEPQEPTGLWEKTGKAPVFNAYPTLVNKELIIESETIIRLVTVYNTLGVVVREKQSHDKKTAVSFAGLLPGMYLITVNGTAAIRVVKQ